MGRRILVADPHASYLAQRDDLAAAALRVLDSGWYVLGEEVRAFEAEFATVVGVAAAAGVASGTDAVELALRGCGVGAGDAVFTVSHTAVATVVGIERAGAVPVLVDVDEQTMTMDVGSLSEAVRALSSKPGQPRPRAIVAVHLYGHPVGMASITELAEQHGLVVVEDCAQAHGASIGGRPAGSLGDAAAFSFYPTKNVGAFGDGGAVTTDDPAVHDRVLALRQYGWQERYISRERGINSRLDEMQAALLRVRLTRLQVENVHRNDVAASYRAGLRDADVVLPAQPSEGVVHAYHQFVIRTSHRDDLRRFLQERGIGSAVLYPQAVHQQPAYSQVPQTVTLAVTERVVDQVLALPMGPHLSAEDVNTVIGAVCEWSRQR